MGGLKIAPPQLAALAKLGPVLPDSYYLAGGVGVSAHLAHRISKDLDLFSTSDPNEILSVVQELPGVVVMNQAIGTLHLVVEGVPVSLIQYRYPLIAESARFPDIPVSVASLDDLACMKLSAIANRGAARDFWDLHSIVTETGKPLAEFLSAFQAKFSTIDIGHVVRSLVYFGDAECEPLPSGLAREHWATVKRDLESWVLRLQE